jgi:deoxycytidine triphosphate deaminase
VLAGWDGHLTLELLNLGPAALRVHRGMPVARLVLFTMDGPVASVRAHPCYGGGGHLGSRYADEFPACEYQR